MDRSAVLHLAIRARENTLAFLATVVEAPFHTLDVTTLDVTKRASLSVSEGWHAWGLGGSRLRRERSGTVEGGYDG